MRSRDGTSYAWLFKADDSNVFELIAGQTSAILTVEKNGTYKVRGEFGFCSFESLPVSLKFITDDIFVPNVFTPNGDEKNSVFEVKTALPISRFSIFNRYGKEVYSNTAGVWDGGDSPVDVYYWYLSYQGCDQEKELKAWVQLVR